MRNLMADDGVGTNCWKLIVLGYLLFPAKRRPIRAMTQFGKTLQNVKEEY